MARKKKHEEHENLERWLVSYADFITLLFAFFVVMYSVSAVNQGKYRVLSDALVASFRSPLKSLEPIQIGDSARSIYNPQLAFVKEPSVFNIPKLPNRHTPGAETEGERVRGEGGPAQGLEGRGIEGRAVEEGAVEGKHRGVVSAEGDVARAFQQLLPPLPETDLPPEALQPGTIVSKGAKIGGFGGVDIELPEPLQDTKEPVDAQKLGTLVDGGTHRGGLGSIAIELPETLREGKAQRDVRAMTEEFAAKLEGLISGDLVAVRSDEKALTVEVEIKDNVLFHSGRADVETKALPVLKELSNVLKQFPYPVRVEGFTDDVPISTGAFPSNWELSAVRAASVVKVLTGAGIEPQRLSAVGYGEYRPIADNKTVDGRQKNRRVILVVEANPDAQPVLQASLPTVPRTVKFDKEAVAVPPPVIPLAPAAPVPTAPAPAVEKRSEPTPPAKQAPPAVPPASQAPEATPLPAAAVPAAPPPAEVKTETVPERTQTPAATATPPQPAPAKAAEPAPLPPPRTTVPASPAAPPFNAIQLPAPITPPLSAPIKLPAQPARPAAPEFKPNALGIKSIWPGEDAVEKP